MLILGFPSDSVVKNLPSNAGDPGDAGSIPGLGRSLEKDIAAHSSILTCKITQTEEPGGLQSIESQRHNLVTEHNAYSNGRHSSLGCSMALERTFPGPEVKQENRQEGTGLGSVSRAAVASPAMEGNGGNPMSGTHVGGSGTPLGAH